MSINTDWRADGVIAAVIIIMIAVVMFLILMAPSIARGEDNVKWTAGDTALQTLYLATLEVDRAQTTYYGSRPQQFTESGWARNFIGEHPTSGQANRYFAACAIGHTVIAAMLPKPYRTVWQSFFIGIEASAISSNVNAGISIRF